jgi:hypothetical protein
MNGAYFLYAIMGRNTKPLCNLYTIDPSKTLDDYLFILAVLWVEEWTKAEIGDEFEFGEDWAGKQVEGLHSRFIVQTGMGLCHKLWKLGVFTIANTAEDAEWRKRTFYSKDRRIHEHP